MRRTPMTEWREHRISALRARDRSVGVVCPYCRRATRAFLASLRGRGKKCRRCGALHQGGWSRRAMALS
jgi:hypothetical protein